MKPLFVLLLAFLLEACSSSPRADGKVKVLRAVLEETPVSVKELFSKVEVVPLETNDSSLLAHVLRVRECNGNYYLLSEDYPAFNHITLMAFDGEGNYIRSIGKVGQGPEEYPWLIYDAAIDSGRQMVYMMSPSGILYLYRLDGGFVRKMTMPERKGYHRLQLLDDETLLGWSASADVDDTALVLADADSARLVNAFWKDYACLNWAYMHSPLYQYGGKTYFIPGVYNRVYEVTKDSLKQAYQWDFGDGNIDMDKYRSAFRPDERERNEEEWKRLRDNGSVPFVMLEQGQSGKYYYAGLFYRFDEALRRPERRSLFYDKETGRSYFFRQTVEGIGLQPEVMTEDHMLMLMPTEELEKLLPVVEEKEKEKIRRRVEDDNPCLVKFVF